MNLLDMMNAAWDFEKQMERWQEALPRAISCFKRPLDLSTVNELQLASWLRCSNIKLRVYRPFLYRFAHRQEQDWPLNDPLRQLAGKAILLCLDPLFNIGLRHRHSGAWFRCRETISRALILICASKIGLLDSMGLEQHAHDTLDICLAHLRYWEAEAEDVRTAREALEIMSSEQ